MGKKAGKWTFIAIFAIQMAAIILSPMSLGVKMIGLAAWYLGWGLALKCFCTGCPGCGEECMHDIPGRVAERFFKVRKLKKYSQDDVSGVIAGCILLVGAPAALLLTVPSALIAYLVFTAIIGAAIVRLVCPHCCNRLCPLNPKRQKSH